MKTKFTFLLGLIGTFFLGCSQNNGEKSNSIRVVVTTSIIGDAVKRIGGDAVTVDCLMAPGVDPHRYNPTAQDLQKLRGAKIIFYNGLHLEGKMADVLEQPREGQAKGVAVCRGLDEKKDVRHADGSHDPHIWFDVQLWMKCVMVIRDELKLLHPEKAELFEKNAAVYLKELEAVHAELKDIASKLPKEKRILVTCHDAFAYFGSAYGFEVHGLQGISTASESSVQDVSALADFLGKNNVAAVFGETSVPDKGLKSVLDAVKTKYGRSVTLVGGDDALYSDSLGEAGSPGETYIGMVRHNMKTIVSALAK